MPPVVDAGHSGIKYPQASMYYGASAAALKTPNAKLSLYLQMPVRMPCNVSEEERLHNETVGIADEANQLAREAEVVLEHEKRLWVLNDAQRRLIKACVYGLNRTVLEMLSAINHIDAWKNEERKYAVCFVLLWRARRLSCIKGVSLSPQLFPEVKPCDLKFWMPSVNSQKYVVSSYLCDEGS
jgi:hypothetical protein